MIEKTWNQLKIDFYGKLSYVKDTISWFSIKEHALNRKPGK